MVCYGVPMADLIKLADSVGARLNEPAVRGKGIKFTIRPTGERYRKVNPISGRRIWAVCWHGHYEFLRALFALYPTARVKSSSATYDGAADFAEKADETDTPCGPSGNVYGRYNESDCCHCSQE